MRVLNYLFFIAYQFAQLLVLPLIIVLFLWRRIKGKPVFGLFLERIGLIQPASEGKESIWIHAVSVGEVLATQRLVGQLKKTFPEIEIYLTTGTAGGLQVAKQHIAADFISYMPYDFLIPMMCAFKRINPMAIIVLEAEIWPNFLLLAWIKKIPVYLLNGRINQAKIWLKKKFLGPVYRLYSHVYAQTDSDMRVFCDLGIRSNRTSVLGNIKAYNVLPKKAEIIQKGRPMKIDASCVMMFASMHEGECDTFFSAYQAAKKSSSRVKAVFAPRHFSWKAALVKQLDARKTSYFLWDEKNPLNVSMDELFKQYDVLVVCVLGKLFDLIALADIFVLGGTFVPVGGHNLLEPAVWGVPMIVGPHYKNTRAIADDLAEAGALYAVTTKQELITRVSELVMNDAKRLEMGAQSEAWLTDQAKLVDCNLTHLFEKINLNVAERSLL